MCSILRRNSRIRRKKGACKTIKHSSSKWTAYEEHVPASLNNVCWRRREALLKSSMVRANAAPSTLSRSASLRKIFPFLNRMAVGASPPPLPSAPSHTPFHLNISRLHSRCSRGVTDVAYVKRHESHLHLAGTWSVCDSSKCLCILCKLPDSPTTNDWTSKVQTLKRVWNVVAEMHFDSNSSAR